MNTRVCKKFCFQFRRDRADTFHMSKSACVWIGSWECFGDIIVFRGEKRKHRTYRRLLGAWLPSGLDSVNRDGAVSRQCGRRSRPAGALMAWNTLCGEMVVVQKLGLRFPCGSLNWRAPALFPEPLKDRVSLGPCVPLGWPGNRESFYLIFGKIHF